MREAYSGGSAVARSVMKAATRPRSAQPTGSVSRRSDLRNHGAAYGCSWWRSA